VVESDLGLDAFTIGPIPCVGVVSVNPGDGSACSVIGRRDRKGMQPPSKEILLDSWDLPVG